MSPDAPLISTGVETTQHYHDLCLLGQAITALNQCAHLVGNIKMMTNVLELAHDRLRTRIWMGLAQ